jgi:hypothetical protein
MAKRAADVFSLLSKNNQGNLLAELVKVHEAHSRDAKAAATSALEATLRDPRQLPFVDAYLTPPLNDKAQLSVSKWIINQASCLTVRQANDLLPDDDAQKVLTDVTDFHFHFGPDDANQNAAAALAALWEDHRLRDELKAAMFTPPLSDEARRTITNLTISLACRRPPATWLAILSFSAQKQLLNRVLSGYRNPRHAEEAFSQLGLCHYAIGLGHGVRMETPMSPTLELKIIEMVAHFACGRIMRSIVRDVVRGDQSPAPLIPGLDCIAENSEDAEHDTIDRVVNVLRIATEDISQYCNRKNKFHRIHLFETITKHSEYLRFLRGTRLSNILLLAALQRDYPADKWNRTKLVALLEWLRDYLSNNSDVRYHYPKARNRHRQKAKSRHSGRTRSDNGHPFDGEHYEQ